jgi:SAM-dependent methyltransferase
MLYGRDLAYVQHHGFGDFTRAAAPGVLSLFARAGITSGHVVDHGCGDGSWLRALTSAGFTATGIDQSRALVGFARKRAPRAKVLVGSAHRIELPSCDAMTALGEVLNYCPGGSGVAPSLRRFLRRAHAAVRPGGLLVFDLLVAGGGRSAPMRYQGWRSGPTWTVLTLVNEDTKRRRLTREVLAFRKTGLDYRRTREVHVLQVPTRKEVIIELRRAGFSAKTMRRYGAYQLARRRVAFVARKRVS